MSISMSEEQYNKIRENVASFIDNEYSKDFNMLRRERIIDIITNDICNNTKESICFCTPTQTEALRKVMGYDSNGERKSYAQVARELNKSNIRELVRTATRHIFWDMQGYDSSGIKSEMVRDKVGYSKEQGTIFPEDISIENLLYSAYNTYNVQRLLDEKIYTANDLISMSIDDANNLLMDAIDTTNVRYASEASHKIIRLIHLLGFVFADEKGYVEQQERFKLLKKMFSNEIETDATVLKFLNERNLLIDTHDKLLLEEETLSQQLQYLEKQLEELKEKIEINKKNIINNKANILNVESKIKIRKL